MLSNVTSVHLFNKKLLYLLNFFVKHYYINFEIMFESQLVKTLRQFLTSEVLEIKTTKNPILFFHFDKSEVPSGLRT